MSDDPALMDRYTGVGDLLDDDVLVNADSGTVHRQADDGAPVCKYESRMLREASWATAKAKTWTKLCRSCWESVLEWEAQKPESPVEEIGAAAADGGEADGFADLEDRPPLSPQPNPTRLGAIPEQVLVSSSGNVYHAPDAEGEPYCQNVDLDRTNVFEKDVDVVRGWRRPCKSCFAEAVVDEEPGIAD